MLKSNSTKKPCLEVGQQFGYLAVVSSDTNKELGRHKWLCKCVCGTIKSVCPWQLTNGKTKSCGCKKTAMSIARKTKHGHSPKHRSSPEYVVWSGMKNRCYSTKNIGYHLYGGRGITVCDEWRNSFEAFLADVGLRPSMAHTLDRRDNSKGYYPENVRWTTTDVQQSNRRDNVYLTCNGITMHSAAWARHLGLSCTTISRRRRNGLPIELVLASGRFRSGRKSHLERLADNAR